MVSVPGGRGRRAGRARRRAEPAWPPPDGIAGARRGCVRGRPRSEAVEGAVIAAVVTFLEQGVPLGELSIERIARTAGVGKATIYRRWQGKEELFLDVLRAVEPADPALPGTCLRDDLIAVLEALRRRGLADRSSALLRNVVTQMKAHPKLWEAYHATVIAPRHRATLDVLRRGLARGELPPGTDLDLVIDLIVGPMLLRSVLRPGAELPEDLPRRIVDTVLDGLRPRQ